MIPDLAIIVSVYVCFRMIEVCLLKSDRYRNGGAHAVAGVLAILTLVVTLFVLFDILSKGSSVGPTLP
jgi:hypothetical protein